MPHRICAVLPWLPMPEKKWRVPRPPDDPNRDWHGWCVDRSVDEGRKAAMRWLIEFVEVKLGKNDKPGRPDPHVSRSSVRISEVGGKRFDLNHPDALTLAKMWKVCSQASLHPTDGTGVDVQDNDLANALHIVIGHLQTALYEPHGRDLWQIIQKFR